MERRETNFQRSDFRNGLSSALVLDERWEVCEAARMQGRCMVLRQGRYPTPTAMGLNSGVVSARIVPANARIDASRLAPDPMAVYDSRRRGNERLYQVQVTSVRAVMGPPEQRCWIEREAINAPPPYGSDTTGAIAGALLAGILGHQVGGGTQTPQTQTRDVQRCSTTPASGAPDHWDVTYTFRGQEHRIQTVTRPGDTITVNRRGEPRS